MHYDDYNDYKDVHYDITRTLIAIPALRLIPSKFVVY